MERDDVMARRQREMAEQSRELSQEEYCRAVEEYAVRTGWVKQESLPHLREQYLVPIYRKYGEIIAEVKGDAPPTDELQEAMRLLNYCMEATRRLGSTDAANILRSLEEYQRRARSHYADYAVHALRVFVASLVA